MKASQPVPVPAGRVRPYSAMIDPNAALSTVPAVQRLESHQVDAGTLRDAAGAPVTLRPQAGRPGYTAPAIP